MAEIKFSRNTYTWADQQVTPVTAEAVKLTKTLHERALDTIREWSDVALVGDTALRVYVGGSTFPSGASHGDWWWNDKKESWRYQAPFGYTARRNLFTQQVPSTGLPQHYVTAGTKEVHLATESPTPQIRYVKTASDEFRAGFVFTTPGVHTISFAFRSTESSGIRSFRLRTLETSMDDLVVLETSETWLRVSRTVTVPSGGITIYVTPVEDANDDVGDAIFIREIMVEAGGGQNTEASAEHIPNLVAQTRDAGGEVFYSSTPPPMGTTYRWTGTPGNSVSEKVVNGEVVETNLIPNGKFVVDRIATRGSRHEYYAHNAGTAYSEVPVGTEVTISFDYEFELNTPGQYVQIYNSNNKGPRTFLSTSFRPGVEQPVAGRFSFTRPLQTRSDITRPESFIEFYSVYDSSNWFKITNLKMEYGPTANPYFDGDTPDERANDLWVDDDTDTPYRWDSATRTWKPVMVSSAGPFFNGYSTGGGWQGFAGTSISSYNPSWTFAPELEAITAILYEWDYEDGFVDIYLGPQMPVFAAGGDLWDDGAILRQYDGMSWQVAYDPGRTVIDERFSSVVQDQVVEYAVGASETIPPASGWSTDTPTRAPGTFIWYRSRLIYADGNESISNPVLLTGNTGAGGDQGMPGPPGADGTSLYTWLKYANGPNGESMSNDPAGKTYIGLAYNKTTPFESNTASDYEWTKIQGDPGVEGPPGPDGQTLYTWIRYALDANGTGITDDPTSKTWIGLSYNRTTPVESNDPSEYTWSKIQGDKGVAGPPGPDGEALYTWLKYADTPTSGMSDSPTGKAYIGLAYNKADYQESTNYADYSWSLIKGDQGIPGPIGPDGESLYTWIKYSNFPDGTNLNDDPTGKAYIGVAYNRPTHVESTNKADYTWSLIQGPKGDQGIQGPPGANGQTTYTWLKYADTPTTGMSDDPTGKTYMGLAYNKSTATESTNYSDYVWSLIRGANGTDGKGVSSTAVGYQTHSSGTTPPTGVWSGAPTATTTGQFLWSRTITTYTDGSTSTSYSVSAHGATGSTGAAGRGITGTAVTYQASSSGTTEPTGTWTTSIPSTTPGQFLWTRTITSYSAAPTSVTSYSVAKHGETGQQGVPGPIGPDGESLYTWVRYAPNGNPSAAQMTNVPTGMTHIGLAYNKATPTESSNPSDYTWALIQGPQGPQGVQGPKGADGIQYYTWIKYADTPTTGMDDSPAGKTYMGIAYNKLTATESANYADYEWSLIRGANGSDGKGISSTEVRYQVHTNGTTAPTGTWLSTIPATTTGQFLWTRTITTYTDSSNSTAYSVAAHGAAGSAGTAGRGITGTTINYQIGTSGTTAPTGTWLTTIPTTTAGQFLWTRTSTAFTSAPSPVLSYSVAAHGATGSQGVPGPPGADGSPTYTWIKYAPSATPTAGQMVDIPQSDSTHIGLAYNKTSQAESSNPGDYTWALIQGAKGADGVSITSVTPFYRKITTGAAPPTTPTTLVPVDWEDTEPGWERGTELYTTTRITYSDGTFTYTVVVRSSSYSGNTTLEDLIRQTQQGSGKVWRQAFAPPSGATYSWEGTPNRSNSFKHVNGTLVAVNHVTDPESIDVTQWRVVGYASNDTSILTTIDGEPAIAVIENAADSSNYVDPMSLYGFNTVGATVYVAYDVRVTMPLDNTRPRITGYNGMTIDTVTPPPRRIKPSDGWVRQEMTGQVTALGSGGYLRALIWPPDTFPVGQGFYTRRWVIASQPTEWFHGNMPDDRAHDLWVNTAENNKPYVWDNAAKTWVSAADTSLINLVDNPSRTGQTGRWFATGGTVTMSTRPIEGVTTPVMEFFSDAHGFLYSADSAKLDAMFRVDPTKAYQFSVWIEDEKAISAAGTNGTTQFYFGIHVYQESRTQFSSQIQVDTSGTVTSASQSNLYFVNATAASGAPIGGMRRYVGYLMPVGTNPAKMTNLGMNVLNNAIMGADARWARMRILNYNNQNTPGGRKFWVGMPTVAEVDPLAIERASTVEANVLLAQTTADGKNSVSYTDVVRGASMPNPTTVGRKNGDIHRFRYTDNGEIARELIMNSSGNWQDIKFGDQIMTSLDVGKLTTGSLGAGVDVYVGDPVAEHVYIGSGKIESRRASQSGPVPAVTMGGPGSAFRVSNVLGEELGGIYEDGSMSTPELSADSIVLQGDNLRDVLSPKADGIPAFLPRTAQSFGPYPAGRTGLWEIRFDAYQGRVYRIDFSGRQAVTGGSRMDGIIGLTHTFAAMGTVPAAPKVTDTNLGDERVTPCVYGTTAVAHSWFYSPAADRTLRLLFYCQCFSPAQVTTSNFEITVVDVGINPSNPGRASLGGASGAPPVAPEPPPQNYVKEWDLSTHQVYTQFGRGDTYAPQWVRHGTASNINSVYRTYLLPPSDCRSIMSSSSTTVTRVDVRLALLGGFAGDPYTGTHNVTSFGTTEPALSNASRAGRTYKSGTNAWFTLSTAQRNALSANTAKGVVIGSRTVSPILQDFYGPSASSSLRPKIKVWYTA